MPAEPSFTFPQPIDMPPEWKPALMELLDAHDSAASYDADPWEYAVEVSQLRELGLTHTWLRLLLKEGIVQQMVELPAGEGGKRRFRKVTQSAIEPRSCFLLTEKGVKLLGSDEEDLDDEENNEQAAVVPFSPPLTQTRPKWDRTARVLSLDGRVIKQFRQPAPLQECILDCFEEEGWPERLDDPLPPVPHLDVRLRLQSAIKKLNRSQVHRLIRFSGDGTGTGICWHRLPESQ